MNEHFVPAKDGRNFTRMEDGSLRRNSVVRMSKKDRRRLKDAQKTAMLQSGAPVVPICDIPKPEVAPRWKDSEEREKLLAEILKEW